MVKSTSNTVRHSYSVPGYFTVKVIVSTTAGNSSTTNGVFVDGMLATCVVKCFTK